jgi:hypothetical protein
MVRTITKLQNSGLAIAVDTFGNVYTTGFPSSLLRIGTDGSITSFPLTGISDYITALAADGKGNIYAGTRGTGAQILQISF